MCMCLYVCVRDTRPVCVCLFMFVSSKQVVEMLQCVAVCCSMFVIFGCYSIDRQIQAFGVARCSC